MAEQIPGGELTWFLSWKDKAETLSATRPGRRLSPSLLHKDATAGSLRGWLREREGPPSSHPGCRVKVLPSALKSQLILGVVISYIRFLILTSLKASRQHPSSSVGERQLYSLEGPTGGKFSRRNAGAPSVSGYQTLTAKHQRQPPRMLAAM